MKHILLFLTLLSTISLCSAQEQWTSVQVMPEGGSIIYTPQVGGEFGWSSASDGDWAIVGTLTDKAVIYYRNPATGMLETNAQLQAVPPVAWNGFGGDVDISGTTAVVGAQFDGTAGSAFVFKYNEVNYTWDLEQELEPSDGAANDRFGEKVAIDGDRIIIGARGHNKGRGAAYVYKRSGNTWTEFDSWSPSEINLGDGFGSAVAIKRDTMMASSTAHYNGQVGYTGAAWLMKDNGTGIEEIQKLTAGPDDWTLYDDFGASLFLNSKYAMVGATGSSLSGVDAGAVFAWKVGPLEFDRMMVALPDLPETGMRCGTEIDAHEMNLPRFNVFIGCPGTNNFNGSVINGEMIGNVYIQKARIESQQPGNAPGFGQSVAAFLGQFIGGANYGTSGTTDSGSIELFDECDEVINTTINWTGVWLESQEFDAQEYTWYKLVDTVAAPYPNQVGMGMNYMPNSAGTYYLKIEKDGCIKIATLNVENMGTEVSGLETMDVQISPNPASETVQFNFPITVNGLVTLTDLQGQVVMSKNVSDASTKLWVSDLPNGSYIAELRVPGSPTTFRTNLLILH